MICMACEQQETESDQKEFCNECEAKCSFCGGGDIYPQYGLAPHTHGEAWKTGRFIGTTSLLPKKLWPDNFAENPQDPGMGWCFCPECGKGKEYIMDRSNSRLLEYKGYIAKATKEANIWYGTAIGIQDKITFQSETPEQLNAEFQKSVDTYLDFCKKLGEEPNGPHQLRNTHGKTQEA